MPCNTVIDFLQQYTAAFGRGHSSVPGDLDQSWAVRVWISAATLYELGMPETTEQECQIEEELLEQSAEFANWA